MLRTAEGEAAWTDAVRKAWAAWGFGGVTVETGDLPGDFVEAKAEPGSDGRAPTPPAALLRRAQNEARALARDLPPGVAVFRFAADPLKFRLVLAGFPGTPYMHGLFVFDLTLPPAFPAQPPRVHYRCVVGKRLNPNLYAEGKVCLSLLGTWAGQDEAEAWRPGESTLRQLIVSLQAFVLNVAHPYFNEPGMERLRGSAEGTARSRQYNETVAFLSMQSAATQRRAPPQGAAGELCRAFLSAIAPRALNMVRCLQGAEAAEVGAAAAADAAALRSLLPTPPSAAFLSVMAREAARLNE